MKVGDKVNTKTTYIFEALSKTILAQNIQEMNVVVALAWNIFSNINDYTNPISIPVSSIWYYKAICKKLWNWKSCSYLACNLACFCYYQNINYASYHNCWFIKFWSQRVNMKNNTTDVFSPNFFKPIYAVWIYWWRFTAVTNYFVVKNLFDPRIFFTGKCILINELFFKYSRKLFDSIAKPSYARWNPSFLKRFCL